ncbi:phospholipid/cholesterol/gamma-HCH transport system ATP-binding protein [Nitrosomonas marina]|uniref:Phospholipid/cholesterol/gamma-HCH transport system ATP-binding protein n=2 Tax=Nitrosomonas marina TaxID=917 RepID=A0A1H8B942_9PROT|nr:phospholipid/cholesterol/gamma-HCH transport system ATP-binding protein [Nitrosomonas marina]
MMTAETLVEISDLNFSYDTRAILNGVNMTMKRGQVIAIMGGSGSGKTTLLKLIGGEVTPSSGYVKVSGQVIHELNRDALFAMRRKMGMLFQFGALFTDLSVFDNVAFQMREHSDLPESMIRDLVLMKLHAVGLRGAHRLMPAQLSGGMSRRVALARSIALDPMLMMFDEPFTGLDPISLSVIGSLIRRLTDALEMTSIIVTHDVQESLSIVDYVYFIADGVIAAHGTPEEVKVSKAPFVHQFVHGETDGPVPFHYPAQTYLKDLQLEKTVA